MTLSVAQLRALVAVADTGSFTRAAHELGISQSAVSHTLAALERETGGALVQRDGAIVLTALGERVLARARPVLRELTALEAAIRPDERHGVVRLAVTPTVTAGLLPRLRSLWSVTVPRVELRLYEGDDEELPEWLEAGTVDAAILISPDPPPEAGVLVGVDEMVAVVRRDHPLAMQPELTLPELHDDGLIAGAGGCEVQLRVLHRLAGLAYRYDHRVRDLATIFAMIERGDGVAVMPTSGRALLPPGLVMVPLLPRVERRLVLAGPRSRDWSAAARALVESVTPVGG